MNVCSNRNLISASLKCLVVSVFHILDIIELTSFRSGLSSVFSLVIVLLITGTNVFLPLDVFMFLEMLSFMRLSFHLLILEVILLSLYHQNGSHLQNLFFFIPCDTMFQSSRPTVVSPDILTAHDSTRFFNMPSSSPSLGNSNDVSPDPHVVSGTIWYIPHDTTLVPVNQTEFDSSPTCFGPPAYTLPDSSLILISSSVPLTTHLMLTKSKSALLFSPSGSPNPSPSTHPMITLSKSCLQASTDFYPSSPDLLNREPISINETLLSPHWATIVQEEMTALLDNHTWSIMLVRPIVFL